MFDTAKLRKFWIQAHRWIGLTLGLVIAIIGVTGSVAVFWRESTEWTNPSLSIAQPAEKWTSYDQMIATIQAAHPDRSGQWVMNLPWGGPSQPIYAVYDTPEEKAGQFEMPLYVAVNQYDGTILGEYYWGETLSSWIYKLHAFLHAGPAGEVFVGVMGLAMLLLAVSGLYLWWPIGAFRKQNFTASPRIGWKHFEFELHKLLGFYSFIILFISSLTGAMLVFSDTAYEGLNAVERFATAEIDETAPPKVTVLPGLKPMSYDAFVKRVEATFPNSIPRSVFFPGAGGNSAYGMIVRQPHDHIDKFYPGSSLWIDQYTGKELGRVDSAGFNATQRLYGYRYAFHGGEALGLSGRIVLAFVGLVPMYLFISGIRHWLRLRRKTARQ